MNLKQSTITISVYVLFSIFTCSLYAQNNSSNGALLAGEHKVMIIPFNMNNYFSDADEALAKANKKQQYEISTLFRYGLNYNVNARVITTNNTVNILTDTTLQSAKDLKMIYDAVSYKYDAPMDIITPDTVQKTTSNKKLTGLDKLLKNGNDDKNMQQNTKTVNSAEQKKYMNAVIVHPEVFSILQQKYGTDLFLFINQFELKTNYEHCLDRDTNNFERQVIVHYSIYNAEGKQLKGDAVTVTFASNTNSIDEIIGKNFPVIGDYMKGSVNNSFNPIAGNPGE